MSPRHNSLEFSIAHHGTPGVTLMIQKTRLSSLVHLIYHEADTYTYTICIVYYLTGVLSSLQIASTDHVLSDLERIYIKACVITQERGIKALQLIRVPRWKRQKNIHQCFMYKNGMKKDTHTQSVCNSQPSSLGRRLPHPEIRHIVPSLAHFEGSVAGRT